MYKDINLTHCSALEVHCWWCFGGLYGMSGSYLDHLLARQVPYMLYYFSGQYFCHRWQNLYFIYDRFSFVIYEIHIFSLSSFTFSDNCQRFNVLLSPHCHLNRKKELITQNIFSLVVMKCVSIMFLRYFL